MLPRPSERQLCLFFFGLSVVLSLSFSAVGLHNSLFETHEFRQFQTAYTTLYLQQDGFSLAYPTPLFGPPWSAPMEFPLYQVCVATLSSWTGLALEPAGRVVAVAFLYAALPAFFGLAGFIGLSRPRRWLALSLLLIAPGYVYYSRSFLIESTALCLAAWFLLAFCRALEFRNRAWLLAAIGFGALAAMTKVTTLGVFLVVAAAFTLVVVLRRYRESGKQKESLSDPLLRAVAITVPVLIAGIAWVRFSDRVKSSNPLSDALTSGHLSWFNFGSLDQRFSSAFWERIYLHTSMVVLSPLNVVLAVVFVVLLGATYRKRGLLLGAAFLAGPLIFANLYFVHDYYFYATGVFMLALLGLAWCQLLDLDQFSWWGRWILIGLSFGLQVAAYTNTYLRTQRYNQKDQPELATILSAATQPDEVVLMFGHDWDSSIPYFAHRRAVMVTDRKATDPASVHTVLDRLPPGQVSALVVTGELRLASDQLAPFINRLGLAPSPVLVSENTSLFLRESAVNETLVNLGQTAFQEFKIPEAATETGHAIARRRSSGAAVDPKITQMLTPRPALLVHPFALAAMQIDGKYVLNAHSPTDVIFKVPTGATEIYAEFGMDPACYVPANHTAGVEFRIEYVAASGEHQVLHSSFLSPTDRPADRGQKSVSLKLPASSEGQIWCRTLPGPTGSISFAWAYWAKVEIK
jgi:4-amino-4-deoxy-L-arabinose transferase-like glycosyltransferase